jgi:hypothetical protein
MAMASSTPAMGCSPVSLRNGSIFSVTRRATSGVVFKFLTMRSAAPSGLALSQAVPSMRALMAATTCGRCWLRNMVLVPRPV